MATGSPQALSDTARTVVCPRCGMSCSLMPLRRPGAYRLVDPDGHGHTAVCISSSLSERPTVRYRPTPQQRKSGIAPQPLAASARRI